MPAHVNAKWQQECAACHVGADKGNFNERGVRIPK